MITHSVAIFACGLLFQASPALSATLIDQPPDTTPPSIPPIFIDSPTLIDPTVYEAEAQAGVFDVATSVDGFSGTGFVELPQNSQLSFPVTINAEQGGLHQIELRYAMPADVKVSDVQLRIDGSFKAQLRLRSIDALGRWATKTSYAQLAPGNHTLEIVAKGIDNRRIAVFVDHLRFSMTPPDQDRFLGYPQRVNEPFFRGGNDNTRAYYATIDPDGDRLTFAKFRERNGFTGIDSISIDGSNPNSANATYQNLADLNFGRDMYVKKAANGDVASYVQNYPSVEDALNKTNLVATVAMEYRAPDDDPTSPKFTTFYVYDKNGKRLNSIDLDGRGEKFVPALCTTCHGGKPKAHKPGQKVTLPGVSPNDFIVITRPGTYQDKGDLGAKWIPWDLKNFGFGASRTEESQQAEFRKLNRLTLCTNPPEANRILIEGWYSDPSASCNSIASTNFDGEFVPSGWAGHETLYRQVVAPSCRACHAQRGTYNTTASRDIYRGRQLERTLEFNSFEDFELYKDEIERLVYDQAMMPAAKVTFDRFWRSSQPRILDDEFFAGLAHQNPPVSKYPAFERSRYGNLRKPGRPKLKFAGVESITPSSPFTVFELFNAVPGETARLNMLPSDFVDRAINWSFEAGPAVSGFPSNKRLTTFGTTAATGQTYQFRATGGNRISDGFNIFRTRVRTDNSRPKLVFTDTDPSTTSIYSILQEKRSASVLGVASCGGNCSCLDCHTNGGVLGSADSVFNLFDSDFGGTDTETAKRFAYRQVVSRIDCRDPDNSLILRKPSTQGLHAGGRMFNFRPIDEDYKLVRRWIVEGARYNLADSVNATGAACEEDADNDSIYDHDDNCPTVSNANQADADGDKIGDLCESDSDNDRVIDDIDNCASDANNNQADSDDDGIGDVCDAADVPKMTLAATAAPTNFVTSGDAITVNIDVANISADNLSNINVTSAALGGAVCTVPQLSAAATATCSAVYFTTEADVSNGSVNIAVNADADQTSTMASTALIVSAGTDGNNGTTSRILVTADKTAPGNYGWYQFAGGAKQWINANCRTQLEAAGRPVVVLNWPLIDAIADQTPVDCATILDNNNGGGSTDDQPPRILTTPDKPDANNYGWVEFTDGTKQWINATCRGELDSAGFATKISNWDDIAGLSDTVSLKTCEAIKAIGSNSNPAEFPRLLATPDRISTGNYGWVEFANNTKQWVDADCRTFLQAGGLTVAALSWPQIDAIADAAVLKTCDEIHP